MAVDPAPDKDADGVMDPAPDKAGVRVEVVVEAKVGVMA
jgi:hypothetical protein